MNRRPFKSGFIAIIGAPNVGKSTLLNQILGEKISITSERPQTTRNRIMGVLHRPNAQFIFLDTPGVHHTRKKMNKRMIRVALSTLADVDQILYLTDAARRDQESDELLLKTLASIDKPVILAINKIDIVQNRKDILPLIEAWGERHDFAAIVPISALKNIQVEDLLDEMLALLPEGPGFFPEDTITDQPARFIASEMIREKVFRLTSREVPYSVAVTIDAFKERPEKRRVDIEATIHVERDSQKGILIGKGGTMLKRIGSAARMDIQRMTGTQVFLRLWVRVRKNWSRNAGQLSGFGY
ncbi:MAG: GTPase Era [Deltaproteobacteria bacterium]|nr:GTPase Era [Deltaproteobacteria bacterium]